MSFDLHVHYQQVKRHENVNHKSFGYKTCSVTKTHRNKDHKKVETFHPGRTEKNRSVVSIRRRTRKLFCIYYKTVIVPNI